MSRSLSRRDRRARAGRVHKAHGTTGYVRKAGESLFVTPAFLADANQYVRVTQGTGRMPTAKETGVDNRFRLDDGGTADAKDANRRKPLTHGIPQFPAFPTQKTQKTAFSFY